MKVTIRFVLNGIEDTKTYDVKAYNETHARQIALKQFRKEFKYLPYLLKGGIKVE